MQFILNSWSKEVMPNCSFIEPQTIYDLDKTGIWGEAVRQAKPIIVNDFQAPHPLKKGYPEGHVTLNKYLTIPVLMENKIVAVVGVGNKEADYNDDDVWQLQSLMSNAWLIADKIKSSDQLIEAKYQLELVTKGSNDGYWDWNLLKQTIEFSEKWKELIGYKKDELPDDVSIFNTLLHPDDLAKTRQEISDYLEKRIPNFSLEFRLMHKLGFYKWFKVRGIAIWSSEGKAIRFSGAITDINETMNYQIKLQTIFDIAEIGLIITDNKGNIIENNKTAEIILQISEEELQSISVFSHQWNILRKDFTKMPNSEFAGISAFTNRKPTANVIMGLQNQNGITWISSSATPINIEGYGVLISFVDITKLIENELELKKATTTMDKLYSIIAHDLRSPFNALLGFSQLAYDDLKKNSYNNLSEYCQLIYQTTRSSYNLLTNLLQWTKLQSGTFQFNPEELNLLDLFHNSYELLNASCSEKRIALHIKIPDNLIIKADPIMIDAVLRNLVNKAIKFTRIGGEIQVFAEKVEDKVRITIQDNGVGISKENIKSL